MNYTANFLGQVVCGGQPVSCELNTAVAEMTTREFLPAPNPTTGVFRMELDEAAVITVLDASGRVVHTQRAVPGVAVVDLSANPVGVYAVRVMGEVVRNYRVVRGE